MRCYSLSYPSVMLSTCQMLLPISHISDVENVSVVAVHKPTASKAGNGNVQHTSQNTGIPTNNGTLVPPLPSTIRTASLHTPLRRTIHNPHAPPPYVQTICTGEAPTRRTLVLSQQPLWRRPGIPILGLPCRIW